MLIYPSYILFPGEENDENTRRLIAELQAVIRGFSARRMNGIFHEYSLTEDEAAAVPFDSPDYEPKFKLRELETTCQLETIDGSVNLVVKVHINEYQDEDNNWLEAGAALMNQLDSFRADELIRTILQAAESRLQQVQPQADNDAGGEDAAHQLQP